MPLLLGRNNVARNIRELHGGKTYARTLAKYGKKKADRQAVAISLSVSKHGIHATTSADRKVRKLKSKIAKSLLPKI